MVSILRRLFDIQAPRWRAMPQCSLAALMLATLAASTTVAAPPAPAKKTATATKATTPEPATPAPTAMAKTPLANKAAATAKAPAAVPARLDTYVKADGTGYFALTLPAEASLPPVAGHDIVVLFDTSASQVGQSRARALKALRTFLSLCQPPDRIYLMAVDLAPVPLTSTFVTADNSELAAGLERLERRVPLGATDLPLALERAAAAYTSIAPSGEETPAKAVVYFGDGVSAAQLFTPPTFAKLAERLVELELPVISYGLGPRVDGQLLASLANYTGGTIVLDEDELDPKEAGLFLAASARGPVLWPRSTTWPKAFEEVYPRHLTPLRADRETVVVGKGIIESEIEVEATGESAGEPWQRRWSAAPSPSSDDFSYFPLLIAMAEKDDGTTLPILGAKGLKQIGRLFLATAAELLKMAEQALSTDNFDDADRLIDEALRRDPNEPEALAMRREIAKRRAAQLVKESEAKPAASSPSGPSPSSSSPSTTKPGATKSGKNPPGKDKAGKTKPATPKTPAKPD